MFGKVHPDFGGWLGIEAWIIKMDYSTKIIKTSLTMSKNQSVHVYIKNEYVKDMKYMNLIYLVLSAYNI